CFSLVASRNRCLKISFSYSGLRPSMADLGDGTVMNCWLPKKRIPTRPNVVLIHGFGANALWQFSDAVPPLAARFNVYVPDLLFFGKSFTTRPERSDAFQAQCVKRALEAYGVDKVILLGLSYGGFVAYSMAAQFPESVEKVVICSSGVCLEEADIAAGLFPVPSVDDAAALLIPNTKEKLRELFQYTFVKFPTAVPSAILEDFIQEMCLQHVEQRKEMLHAIAKDRKLSDLPKISQPTLIIWGEKDQIFPLELAHRLQRHLGEIAEMEVIKNTGHACIFEKSKEFNRRVKKFLL
ncbi:hypothetical protein M569_17440, partial [Genlisea aurea]